jgi:hypothetical protein
MWTSVSPQECEVVHTAITGRFHLGCFIFQVPVIVFDGLRDGMRPVVVARTAATLSLAFARKRGHIAACVPLRSACYCMLYLLEESQRIWGVFTGYMHDMTPPKNDSSHVRSHFAVFPLWDLIPER